MLIYLLVAVITFALLIYSERKNPTVGSKSGLSKNGHALVVVLFSAFWPLTYAIIAFMGLVALARKLSEV